MGKCPTPGCNTLWSTRNDLGKRIKYHCHLTDEWEQIFHKRTNGRIVDRHEYYQHGLPIGGKIMASGEMKYSYVGNNGDAQSVITKVKI